MTMRDDSVRRHAPLDELPDPRYKAHGGYGRAFPKPTLILRLKALVRFTPWFALVLFKRLVHFDRLPVLPDYDGAYAGGLIARLIKLVRYLPHIVRGIFSSTERAAKPSSPVATAILKTMRSDGISTVRLDPDELVSISDQVDPYRRQLASRRSASAKRTFEGNQIWVPQREAAHVYSLLEDMLARHGIVEAASAYLGRPVGVKHLVLQVNDPGDMFQHNKFADVGLPDPATNYMHIDTTDEILKALVYLREVTDDTGPFSYVRGSNRIRMGWFEALVRRANDRAGFSSTAPEARRLFMALPSFLQKKATFGSDLLDEFPETKELVGAEYRFTSRDGDAAMFDNLGVHRGALVKEGEREVLFAVLS